MSIQYRPTRSSSLFASASLPRIGPTTEGRGPAQLVFGCYPRVLRSLLSDDAWAPVECEDAAGPGAASAAAYFPGGIGRAKRLARHWRAWRRANT
eukprot:5175820-Pyramimonas_sp.AAC.1